MLRDYTPLHMALASCPHWRARQFVLELPFGFLLPTMSMFFDQGPCLELRYEFRLREPNRFYTGTFRRTLTLAWDLETNQMLYDHVTSQDGSVSSHILYDDDFERFACSFESYYKHYEDYELVKKGGMAPYHGIFDYLRYTGDA